MTDYKPRDIAPAIQHALDEMPAAVLTGMRQAGKSTLLCEDPRFKHRRYVTLDDFAQLQAAKNAPESFLQSDEPLTIDEAQRCPELLVAVKREVDRDRRPGRFLLSGRAVYLTLSPFSRRELAGNGKRPPALKSFFESGYWPKNEAGEPISNEEVFEGGMPPVAIGKQRDVHLWFKGYEQTYLERDIRNLSQVADLLAFRQLLRLAARRSGSLLSPSELARDAKLKAATASRWGDKDLSGLKAFLAATPQCRAAILAYNGSSAVKPGDRLWAAPLSVLLG